jgi:hypothetical protein
VDSALKVSRRLKAVPTLLAINTDRGNTEPVGDVLASDGHSGGD